MRGTKGFMKKWGLSLFLMLFSPHFGFIAPNAAGVYLIVANLSYPLKKYVDYDELYECQKHLDLADAAAAAAMPTATDNVRVKEDYKRFLLPENEKKELVFSRYATAATVSIARLWSAY